MSLEKHYMMIIWITSWKAWFVQMYVGTFRRTNGSFAVLLWGLLPLAGRTLVLVKFEHIFVIFRSFRGSSTIFSSVLVRYMIQNVELHEKYWKCTFTRTGKISIQKVVHYDFIHVTTATSKFFATRKVNLLICCVYLLTYTM